MGCLWLARAETQRRRGPQRIGLELSLSLCLLRRLVRMDTPSNRQASRRVPSAISASLRFNNSPFGPSLRREVCQPVVAVQCILTRWSRPNRNDQLWHPVPVTWVVYGWRGLKRRGAEVRRGLDLSCLFHCVFFAACVFGWIRRVTVKRHEESPLRSLRLCVSRIHRWTIASGVKCIIRSSHRFLTRLRGLSDRVPRVGETQNPVRP